MDFREIRKGLPQRIVEVMPPNATQCCATEDNGLQCWRPARIRSAVYHGTMGGSTVLYFCEGHQDHWTTRG